MAEYRNNLDVPGFSRRSGSAVMPDLQLGPYISQTVPLPDIQEGFDRMDKQRLIADDVQNKVQGLVSNLKVIPGVEQDEMIRNQFAGMLSDMNSQLENAPDPWSAARIAKKGGIEVANTLNNTTSKEWLASHNYERWIKNREDNTKKVISGKVSPDDVELGLEANKAYYSNRGGAERRSLYEDIYSPVEAVESGIEKLDFKKTDMMPLIKTEDGKGYEIDANYFKNLNPSMTTSEINGIINESKNALYAVQSEFVNDKGVPIWRLIDEKYKKEGEGVSADRVFQAATATAYANKEYINYLQKDATLELYKAARNQGMTPQQSDEFVRSEDGQKLIDASVRETISKETVSKMAQDVNLNIEIDSDKSAKLFEGFTPGGYGAEQMRTLNESVTTIDENNKIQGEELNNKIETEIENVSKSPLPLQTNIKDFVNKEGVVDKNLLFDIDSPQISNSERMIRSYQKQYMPSYEKAYEEKDWDNFNNETEKKSAQALRVSTEAALPVLIALLNESSKIQNGKPRGFTPEEQTFVKGAMGDDPAARTALVAYNQALTEQTKLYTGLNGLGNQSATITDKTERDKAQKRLNELDTDIKKIEEKLIPVIQKNIYNGFMSKNYVDPFSIVSGKTSYTYTFGGGYTKNTSGGLSSTITGVVNGIKEKYGKVKAFTNSTEMFEDVYDEITEKTKAVFEIDPKLVSDKIIMLDKITTSEGNAKYPEPFRKTMETLNNNIISKGSNFKISDISGNEITLGKLLKDQYNIDEKDFKKAELIGLSYNIADNGKIIHYIDVEYGDDGENIRIGVGLNTNMGLKAADVTKIIPKITKSQSLAAYESLVATATVSEMLAEDNEINTTNKTALSVAKNTQQPFDVIYKLKDGRHVKATIEYDKDETFKVTYKDDKGTTHKDVRIVNEQELMWNLLRYKK